MRTENRVPMPCIASATALADFTTRADEHLDIVTRIGHDCPMATGKKTVTFIVDQLSRGVDVSAKPMFGEYGLYRDGKMFGMTRGPALHQAYRRWAGVCRNIDEAAPYRGAKPCLLVDADRWDDGDWPRRPRADHDRRAASSQTEGVSQAEIRLRRVQTV